MSRQEIPANRDLAALAPKVRLATEKVLAGMAAEGFKAKQYDTLRTQDRQAFLFGKGRTPEQLVDAGCTSVCFAWPTCADGKVTNCSQADQSWHGYGLAVDIVEDDATPWTAAQAFWHAVSTHGVAAGFVWGGSWKRFPDLPHLQWAKCPISPTEDDKLLLKTKGKEAVWAKYDAA